MGFTPPKGLYDAIAFISDVSNGQRDRLLGFSSRMDHLHGLLNYVTLAREILVFRFNIDNMLLRDRTFMTAAYFP